MPCRAALMAALLSVPVLPAQSPSFAVVSVKRNLSDSQERSMTTRPGGRIAAINATLRVMIRNIYQLQEIQLVGGPDWVATDRWDIIASAERDLTDQQLVEMAKTLLAERFQLRMHVETRDMPVYALVMARPDRALGPRLRRSTVDCAVAKTCGDRSSPGETQVVGRELSGLARLFERISGRIVVDRTQLAGPFDFTLRWRPDDNSGVNADQPSLFTAIEEQLGLKLQPDRQPIEVRVIDSVERAAED